MRRKWEAQHRKREQGWYVRQSGAGEDASGTTGRTLAGEGAGGTRAKGAVRRTTTNAGSMSAGTGGCGRACGGRIE